ncbi:VOC family protein [Falsirhodobacter sp. 1013]|uniref:VOC family protein n=1 Tax=Falsirhodobacter sp. 1013 TaxID=3417566 RepID=UPI003EBCCD66
MAVRGIEHVGMTVPDITEAERFFINAFGAEVLYRVVSKDGPDQPGRDMTAVNGVPSDNGFRALSMLRIAGGANLELFEAITPTSTRVPEVTDMGVHHFSVYCDDVRAVGEAIAAAGGTMLKGPNPFFGQEAGEGNYLWFGRCPWGSLIELLQFPTPPACDALGATHMRWQPPPA